MESGKTDPLPSKGQLPSINDLFQGTAGIVAALGVFLALLFVVLNSAYVYFYEMLGVTPEDVGFDRLSILARTAGLLAPAFILGAIILAVLHYCPNTYTRKAFWAATGILGVILVAAILAFLFRASSAWLGSVAIVIGFLTSALYLAFLAKMGSNSYVGAACWAFLVLTLLIGIRATAIAIVRPGINQALEGHPVRLIQFLDFQAIPARVIWLNSSEKPPILLRDPDLLYLGHGPRGQVFLACGNVVAVPSNLVIVEDGFHLVPHTDSLSREHFCINATHHEG